MRGKGRIGRRRHADDRRTGRGGCRRPAQRRAGDRSHQVHGLTSRRRPRTSSEPGASGRGPTSPRWHDRRPARRDTLSGTSSTTTTATCRSRSWGRTGLPYQVPDGFGGTPQERSAATSTYLSYSVLFEVRTDAGVAIPPDIEVSSFPNWVGKDQERFAQLEGNTLTLSTKPMIFQGAQGAARWNSSGSASAPMTNVLALCRALTTLRGCSQSSVPRRLGTIASSSTSASTSRGTCSAGWSRRSRCTPRTRPSTPSAGRSRRTRTSCAAVVPSSRSSSRCTATPTVARSRPGASPRSRRVCRSSRWSARSTCPRSRTRSSSPCRTTWHRPSRSRPTRCTRSTDASRSDTSSRGQSRRPRPSSPRPAVGALRSARCPTTRCCTTRSCSTCRISGRRGTSNCRNTSRS